MSSSTSPPPPRVPGDDASLVERARSGDEAAFSALLTRHRTRVFALAVRMVQNAEDATDIAQEAFVKAFHSLAGFDLDRSFGAWIARITVNLCIDHYRRRRLPLVSLDAPAGGAPGRRAPEAPDPRPVPDERLVIQESERRLEELIASLPPRYRAVVLLRYLEDLSYEEVAQALGLPIGTVKARLHRAHRMLKRRLKPMAEGQHEG